MAARVGPTQEHFAPIAVRPAADRWLTSWWNSLGFLAMERSSSLSARKHWQSFQSLSDTTMGAAIEIAWLYSLRTKNNGRLPRCKSLKYQ
jgi:hypothetical protein